MNSVMAIIVLVAINLGVLSGAVLVISERRAAVSEAEATARQAIVAAEAANQQAREAVERLDRIGRQYLSLPAHRLDDIQECLDSSGPLKPAGSAFVALKPWSGHAIQQHLKPGSSTNLCCTLY